MWEILRISFISTLYRMWVRSYIANIPNCYESRHVILSTISTIRSTIRIDAHRALFGSEQILRNGTVVEIPRHREFFNASWILCDWAQMHGTLVQPNISALFPIVCELRGLTRLHFQHRSSTASNFIT